VRIPDGVSLATDAIFQDGCHVFGAFESFFIISAYMAASKELLVTPKIDVYTHVNDAKEPNKHNYRKRKWIDTYKHHNFTPQKLQTSYK